MPKYRDTFRELMKDHADELTAFKAVHDRYAENQEANQAEFNEQGKPIVELIRDYERRLCGKMERGLHGKYSANLSEKFWDEVRAFFPLIDFVGVTYS